MPRTGAAALVTGALLLAGCAAEEGGSRLSERQRDSVLATRSATVAQALAARDSSVSIARRDADVLRGGGEPAAPVGR